MSERTVGKYLREQLDIEYQRAVQLVRKHRELIHDVSLKQNLSFKEAAVLVLREKIGGR